MEFFDEAVNKAKEVFDVACKKTGEVVTVQKQRYELSVLEAKKSDDFRALGELYYNKLKEGLAEDGDSAELVAAIDDKNSKITKLKDEINNIKNKRICPKCGGAVEKSANYCNICGARLVYENTEE